MAEPATLDPRTTRTGSDISLSVGPAVSAWGRSSPLWRGILPQPVGQRVLILGYLSKGIFDSLLEIQEGVQIRPERTDGSGRHRTLRPGSGGSANPGVQAASGAAADAAGRRRREVDCRPPRSSRRGVARPGGPAQGSKGGLPEYRDVLRAPVPVFAEDPGSPGSDRADSILPRLRHGGSDLQEAMPGAFVRDAGEVRDPPGDAAQYDPVGKEKHMIDALAESYRNLAAESMTVPPGDSRPS